MVAALRARGVRCDHVVFPGEGHGFRRAETLTRCAELELAFVGDVLGFAPRWPAPPSSAPARDRHRPRPRRRPRRPVPKREPTAGPIDGLARLHRGQRGCRASPWVPCPVASPGGWPGWRPRGAPKNATPAVRRLGPFRRGHARDRASLYQQWGRLAVAPTPWGPVASAVAARRARRRAAVKEAASLATPAPTLPSHVALDDVADGHLPGRVRGRHPRSAGPRGAVAEPERRDHPNPARSAGGGPVREPAGHGKPLYRDVDGHSERITVAAGQPAYDAYNPYLPLMVAVRAA